MGLHFDKIVWKPSIIQYSTGSRLLGDLIEDGEMWELEPKPARLWWSSTEAEEVKEDRTIKTRKGQCRYLSKKASTSAGTTSQSFG